MTRAPLSRTCWASAVVAACVGLAVIASPRAARADRTPPVGATSTRGAVVIPPGHEELFAAMLGRGATLPDGCVFATGQIEHSLVRGVYTCSGDRIVVELRHPSAAPPDAVRTPKIAIVATEGTAPAALLAALRERVREREVAFAWPEAPKARATRVPGCKTLAPLPGWLAPWVPGCYPLFTAVLVGVAQTLVMVLGVSYGLRRLYRAPRVPAGD
jgi:hypothetical protein